MPDPLRIRLMTVKDVEFGLALCVLAGWNQTERDWLNLWICARDGCFVAEWEGKPVGTVTTTRYGTDLAWIGMMLVHPAQRRKGIGRALMNHALMHLRSRAVRCIKLDATPEGKPLYALLGFDEEWTLTRWTHALLGGLKSPPNCKVRERRAEDWGALQNLDSRAFGADRLPLIRQMQGVNRLSCVGISPKGRINSFGFMRTGRLAVYIGPIIGESLPAAAPAIKVLLASVRGRPVFWDIPDAQTGAIELAKRLGFEPARQLTRMFLGENHCPGDPRMIFGLAAPEVG